jgi:hypothetical protein
LDDYPKKITQQHRQTASVDRHSDASLQNTAERTPM